jgi:SRSO17 transposase
MGLESVAGVQSRLSLWRPGGEPLPPKPRRAEGRPPKLRQRNAEHKPASAHERVLEAGDKALRTVRRREGGKGRLNSRFRTVRLRPAHRDYWRSEPHADPWLLVEWPRGAAEPTQGWLSDLPAKTPRKKRVELAKHRWIVERDDLAPTQERGRGHFGGRSWRRLHHHARWRMTAYGFLTAERSRFSPGPHRPAQAQSAAAARDLPAPGWSRAGDGGLIRTRSAPCGRN